MGYLELRQLSERYDASEIGKRKCDMICGDYQKQVGREASEGQMLAPSRPGSKAKRTPIGVRTIWKWR